MSLDLAAFHAYAQGELDVYPGDWFGDAALLAEEVGRLREALERLASHEGFAAIGSIPHDMWGDELRERGKFAEAALAQDTVERR